MAEETPQTTAQLVRSYILESEIEALFIDGFDEAIIGIGNQFNTTLIVYSKAKIINQLISEGCTDEEAIEYFEFNIAGAWFGEHTPFILDDFFMEWIGISTSTSDDLSANNDHSGFNLRGDVQALIGKIKGTKYS